MDEAGQTDQIRERVRKQVLATYAERTRASKRIADEAVKYIPSGDTRAISYFAPYPTYGDTGKGCSLTDYDGNQYIDFMNLMTAAIHGHAHPAIVDAQLEQVRKGVSHGIPAESQYKLAKILVDRVPSVEQVRFTNTGSEACLFAMRAARAFTGRDVILKMDGGYHGSSDYAQTNEIADVFTPNPPQLFLANRGIPNGILANMRVVDYLDLEAATRVMEAEGEKIAAIMLEPVLGAGGLIDPPASYLHGLRELCDRHGALLVFDEVISFRLSLGGKQLLANVRPDLTTFGKIIGGGIGIGALGGRAEVMQLFDPRQENSINQSGTFTGNPLAMVSGIASLKNVTQPELDRMAGLNARLYQRVQQKIDELGINLSANPVGSMMAVYGTRERFTTSREAIMALIRNKEAMRFFHLELLNRGVVCLSRGLFSISTPMDEAVVDDGIERICAALQTIAPLCVG
jgi:glutamate-1-semialdehyde 2,1-aminomutase